MSVTHISDAAKIVKINVDDNPEAAAKYGILSIPTLMVFQDGKVVNQMTGLQSKEQLKAVHWKDLIQYGFTQKHLGGISK